MPKRLRERLKATFIATIASRIILKEVSTAIAPFAAIFSSKFGALVCFE